MTGVVGPPARRPAIALVPDVNPSAVPQQDRRGLGVAKKTRRVDLRQVDLTADCAPSPPASTAPRRRSRTRGRWRAGHRADRGQPICPDARGAIASGHGVAVAEALPPAPGFLLKAVRGRGRERTAISDLHSIRCLTSARSGRKKGSTRRTNRCLGGSRLPCRGQEAPQRALRAVSTGAGSGVNRHSRGAEAPPPHLARSP